MKKNMTFEQAMIRLDEIVTALDSGEAPLDKSLKLFGEGAELLAFCTGKLDSAKLQIEKLFPDPDQQRTGEAQAGEEA